jgi:hypothetical protein
VEGRERRGKGLWKGLWGTSQGRWWWLVEEKDEVTHLSCGGMLNKLPMIGIRLGPGGYDMNILLAYNTNHAKLNRSILRNQGKSSYRRGAPILGWYSGSEGWYMRGMRVWLCNVTALYDARSVMAMADCWHSDEARNSKEVTYACRNHR